MADTNSGHQNGMQISSNLAGVIGRAQRLRDRDVPAAMARTLLPGNWMAAEQTLLVVAQPAERQFIPDFIKTPSVATIGGSFPCAWIHHSAMKNCWKIAGSARAALSPDDLSQSLFLDRVQEFENIADWRLCH
ncbi:MAG TPA: hypothetical protein VMH30_06835 [Verrucomicrobiae bacterium]|nr:hypothetical protein [Verrucomicrobiae bacterium]